MDANRECCQVLWIIFESDNCCREQTLSSAATGSECTTATYIPLEPDGLCGCDDVNIIMYLVSNTDSLLYLQWVGDFPLRRVFKSTVLVPRRTWIANQFLIYFPSMVKLWYSFAKGTDNILLAIRRKIAVNFLGNPSMELNSFLGVWK